MEKIQFTEDEYFFVRHAIMHRLEVVERFTGAIDDFEPELLFEYKKEHDMLRKFMNKIDSLNWWE